MSIKVRKRRSSAPKRVLPDVPQRMYQQKMAIQKDLSEYEEAIIYLKRLSQDGSFPRHAQAEIREKLMGFTKAVYQCNKMINLFDS